MCNRNYSPSLGIWISQDPAVYINGANRYQFVESSPVGNTDHLGLQVDDGEDGEDDRNDRIDVAPGEAWPPALSAPEGYYWTHEPIVGPPGVEPSPGEWYLTPKDPTNKATPPVPQSTDTTPSFKQQQVFRATDDAKRGDCPAVKDPDNNFEQHVLPEHLDQGRGNPRNKSLFNSDQDIWQLIQNAGDGRSRVQRNGNIQYVVNAGQDIGVDRATGGQTQVYTVITDGNGNLITAYPGKP